MPGLASKTMVALSMLLAFNGIAQADNTTYGWIEKTQVEALGVKAKAKLDSGALTSSIHAEEIEHFEREGEDWVRFILTFEDEHSGDKASKRLERPLHRDLTVRGAGGKEDRPVVLLKICMGHTIYEEQFSLNDRGDMLYPVLLGRRTIQHLGNIDVTRTFLHEPQCDEQSPVKTFAEQQKDEDIGA